ncbi:hypothetical protein [Emergencia timonensis]|uniref:hypothetical protein n=1 Tax=Emergencia timonensis TaxID=1776384 RepID=UPI00083136AD|nr:hypothetical protein [Emergencia timonensis]
MKNNGCIDAGREGCPCALAEYGKCLVCSKLRGGSCEDCNWQGSCIYTLYQQNARKLVKARQDKTYEIAEIKQYGENFKVFVLKADKGFCQKAQTAGAYVFVRASESEEWYGMPVSVLKAEPEKERLHLGVSSCGPKSGSLLAAEKTLCVRGVYYNALSGMGGLDAEPEGSLIYAKGIAMAPLRNFLDGGTRYSKWLKNMNLYVDLDKVGFDFFKDYFGDLPVDSIHVKDFASGGLESTEVLNNMEQMAQTGKINILSLTSPYYADKVEPSAGKKIVRPTSGNMCCGEGVCGACTYDDETGKTIHRCKARI